MQNDYWIVGKELERYLELERLGLQFHALFNEQAEVNERDIAIVGASMLDLQLEHMLINFLVDDEKEVGQLLGRGLGNFHNRIGAAYCLGLICKTVRDDLRLIGQIRNKFAHVLETSFDQDPVRSWCLKLKWHEFGMMMRAPGDATPREIFQVGVNQVICNLSGRVGLARFHRRKVPNDDVGGPTLLR